MIIGIATPTYNRPDLARSVFLQFNMQSTPPDIYVFHQNSQASSYRWAIEDFIGVCSIPKIEWLHSPDPTKENDWYRIPIQFLCDSGADVIFWADHDDLYRRDHIEKSLKNLQNFDITLNERCGVLYLQQTYRYVANAWFKSHAPGGMSSSMCFTREFALEFLKDMEDHHKFRHADELLANITMPKFRVNIQTESTTTYVIHKDTVSSSHWLCDNDG
jgi:hypothetical protein